MTGTRYSAEELRKVATYCEQKTTPTSKPWCGNAAPMLRQAAADAETLAGIRAWLEAQRDKAAEIAAAPFDWPTTKHGAMMTGSVLENGLRELDRLSRGDA